MLNNIIAILLSVFVLWGLEHDGYFNRIVDKEIRRLTFNDILIIVIGVGAMALLIKSIINL